MCQNFTSFLCFQFLRGGCSKSNKMAKHQNNLIIGKKLKDVEFFTLWYHYKSITMNNLMKWQLKLFHNWWLHSLLPMATLFIKNYLRVCQISIILHSSMNWNSILSTFRDFTIQAIDLANVRLKNLNLKFCSSGYAEINHLFSLNEFQINRNTPSHIGSMQISFKV